MRHGEVENKIWWDANKDITHDQFDRLHQDMLAYASGRDLIKQNLRGGADKHYAIKVRVFTEYAWHSLFIQHLLVRPPMSERGGDPDFTIVDLPGFEADPAFMDAPQRLSSQWILFAVSFSSAARLMPAK